jgi:hypothetical protein
MDWNLTAPVQARKTSALARAASRPTIAEFGRWCLLTIILRAKTGRHSCRPVGIARSGQASSSAIRSA